MKRRAPAPPDAAARVFAAALEDARTYADLLADAGVERGLVGPREVDRLWERHLLNCAAVAGLVPPRSAVLDVGSGAGLPGIPLALVRPDVQVRLVEPLLRRATFLEEAVQALGLATVEVVRARAEDLPEGQADVVVARAVAPLRRLVGATLPLLRPDGLLVAMKGRAAHDEVAEAVEHLRRLGARSWDVHDLEVAPGVDPTRAVVVVAGGPPAHR